MTTDLLSSLVHEKDEMIWIQNLTEFCLKNEKNTTFSIEKKEEFLQLSLDVYLLNEEYENKEIRKWIYNTMCYLLRENKGLTPIVSNFQLLDKVTEETLKKRKERKREYLVESDKCLVNLLHQNDKLRSHFTEYLLESKFETLEPILESNDLNDLFLLGKLLFYSTHSGVSCRTLYKENSKLFETSFSKLNTFLSQLNEEVTKQKYFEFYVSDTIKLLFNLFAHLEDGQVFFNQE
jgi:hypothetical protein